MLKLAKVLHHKGFHITFVNTEFNHRRFLRSRGQSSLKELPSFRYETIPDGFPDSDGPEKDAYSLLKSTSATCLPPFRELLIKLNDTVSSHVPPVSCVVSDLLMKFTLDAAEELGVPGVCFSATSAFFTYIMHQITPLFVNGYLPLKDKNGYLDTVIDDIPIMEGMCLRDLPTTILTCSEDIDMELVTREDARLAKASGFIINTFEELEDDALSALDSILPSAYAIGPLNLLEKQANNDNKDIEEVELSRWKQETDFVEWLDSKDPNSVVYVNFGSISIVTTDHLVEFAWGLANSNQNFLWIIRPDLVLGEKAVVSPSFLESTKERGMVVSWCPQEKVLGHSSIGGFLTHSGWNSVLESISCGVPMICWSSFADQPTNCWRCCNELGIGMKLNDDVKRDAVERLVRELIIGEKKGKEMKKKAMDWMKLAHHAADSSSMENLDKVINQVLLLPRRA